LSGHRSSEGDDARLTSPRWARALVARLAPAHQVDDAVGDLEEAHRARAAQHGRVRAELLTAFDALDMARALLRSRGSGGRRPGSEALRPADGRGQYRPGSRWRGVFSWLDVKLGARMLVKYPGLTVVAGVAMAFAIAVGAASFEFLRDVMHPRLPLPEGDRVVRVQTADAQTGRRGGVEPADFARWREQLRSVEQLGAFRPITRVVRVGEAA
jgi:hypothetical protein